MNMAHTVTCPHCGKSYGTKARALGKKATCPDCGKKFLLKETPLSKQLSNSAADRLRALAEASRNYDQKKRRRKRKE